MLLTVSTADTSVGAVGSEPDFGSTLTVDNMSPMDIIQWKGQGTWKKKRDWKDTLLGKEGRHHNEKVGCDLYCL